MKKIVAILFVSCLFFCFLRAASQPVSPELRQMIGKMLVMGFDGTNADAAAPDLRRYNLGGVILFDRYMDGRAAPKNIASPEQLQSLTRDLRAAAPGALLICVDQEGGKVARLKPAKGFVSAPSAAQIGRGSETAAKREYAALAGGLASAGINCDFAPVVDLAANPENRVIVGLGRAYGKDAETVVRYATIFQTALHEAGVLGVLKHFPGHGSSLGDSHEGFVDISDTWSKEELEPYRMMIESGRADAVMTAHVFNRHLDAEYPATLSRAIVTGLLRNQLGFDGVVVSDDMQMKALSERYPLEERVALAINAGVDLLLFGNQLDTNSPGEVIEAVARQVQSGNIAPERIQAANRRIDALMNKLKATPSPVAIYDRPIRFGPERVALTKAYIRDHYGLEVSDIRITPRIIVLHWTADMGLDSSFSRLEPEILPGARADIAKAGALNVSAHFLVARDGTIYRLMPENFMARHTIGLNYGSIGIENVGGENNAKEDLTQAQVAANIALVCYLKAKFPSIRYLIGHHEYRRMEVTPLWLERDKGYRTQKSDPGPRFMHKVRAAVRDLNLSQPPEAR